MHRNHSKFFLKHYPGPYGHNQGTDGTENTFDLHCTRTNKNIISTYYWYKDVIPERDIRIVAAALQSLHHGIVWPFEIESHYKLFESFVADYPGPFDARHIVGASWPAWEVFCKSTDQCVIYDPAESDEVHARKLAEHIAFALNEFVSRSSDKLQT